MFSAARNQQLDPKYVIDDLDKLMVAAVVITFYSTAIIVLISAVAGASAQHRMTEAVHAPEATYKKEMVQSRQEDQLLKMALELSRASAPTLASPVKSSGSPLAAVQIPRGLPESEPPNKRLRINFEEQRACVQPQAERLPGPRASPHKIRRPASPEELPVHYDAVQ